jgi:hypothetical protein
MKGKIAGILPRIAGAYQRSLPVFAGLEKNFG